MLLNKEPYIYDDILGTEYYFLKHLEQIGGFPNDIVLNYVDINRDDIDDQVVYLIELALDNRTKIGYNILVNKINEEQTLTEDDLSWEFFAKLTTKGDAYYWRNER